MRTPLALVVAVVAALGGGCAHEVDEGLDPDLDAAAGDDGALGAAPSTCAAITRPAKPATCPFGGNEVLVWASEGWNALADVAAADVSPCSEYFISIPPVTSDKTKLRANEAANMRARGAQFHALAELHFGAWNKERQRLGIGWREVGRRFREEMEAKGYCVAAGDTWVVQEAPSVIRRDAAFRDGFAELLRGLHEGRAGMPEAKGAVLVVGLGQRTENVSVYKANLKTWLADADFWTAANATTRFWSQEVYVDPRFTCLGAGAASYRRQRVNEYSEHFIRLAFSPSAPASANTARSYLGRAFVPLLNGVWFSTQENGYGDTTMPLAQMQRFVRMQVDATRNFAETRTSPDGRIGFGFGSYHTPKEWEDIGATLADAVSSAYGEGGVAGRACDGDGGCACSVEGAEGNPAWAALGTW